MVAVLHYSITECLKISFYQQFLHSTLLAYILISTSLNFKIRAF